MPPKNNHVIIIGAGFGGLTAASYLARAGYAVTVLEKNTWLGGRAQTWESQGYTFDMGPSWYWMPDIFDSFFQDFHHQTRDFYQLARLNPSYRIYFDDEMIDLPASREGMCDLFERYEAGAGTKLHLLLEKTAKVYAIAMKQFVPFPYHTFMDIFKPSQIGAGLQLLAQYNGFMSVDSFLKKYFAHPKLVKMLSFPIFFLGESTKNIPSVYSLMNHVDIDQGTWHPIGGFGKVAEAFSRLAKEQGVNFIMNQEVKGFAFRNRVITEVKTQDNAYPADIVISNNDYHDTEANLLPSQYQSYSSSYWHKRKLAPSALLIYLGLNQKVPHLLHHTLFFHQNWEAHNNALFEKHKWPEKPLYYVSSPSKTDTSLAPPKKDLLTILIPIASGLSDTPHNREYLANEVIKDLERKINFPITQAIVTQRLYSLDDFTSDYHAYQGNGYGLGQTLLQTAIFRPQYHSQRVKNLFYTGQFTIPGIGVPLVVISGKLVARAVIKKYDA